MPKTVSGHSKRQPKAGPASFTIRLPIVPDMLLSLNGHMGFRARAERKQATQEEFGWTLRAHGAELPHFIGPVRVQWTVCFGDRRRRDLDNVEGALKSWLDTISGFHATRNPYGMDLIEADDPSILVGYEVKTVSAKKDEQWTELRIIPEAERAARRSK